MADKMENDMAEKPSLTTRPAKKSSLKVRATARGLMIGEYLIARIYYEGNIGGIDILDLNGREEYVWRRYSNWQKDLLKLVIHGAKPLGEKYLAWCRENGEGLCAINTGNDHGESFASIQEFEQKVLAMPSR